MAQKTFILESFYAHIVRSTKMFAQIKRRLPPRGGSRRSRVEEYACIINFNIFMPKNSFRHCFAMPHVRAAPSVCFADVSPSYGERPLKGRLGYFAPDKRNITKIHYRSRFAPSLGSGSTTKISHREIFSAQDDTNKVCVLKTAGDKPPPYGEIFINFAFCI